MNDNSPQICQFSAGYELVRNVAIETVPQEEAVMDYKLLDLLREEFGEPIIGFIGGLHYQFKSETKVPANTVAIPERNHDDPSALLIQK